MPRILQTHYYAIYMVKYTKIIFLLQRPVHDNTKEKCRKFLANLLELSSREPKSVERNVRTLIQELIDNKVEPEDFCDKLERLLNASPQPCLIGFLKVCITFLLNGYIFIIFWK